MKRFFYLLAIYLILGVQIVSAETLVRLKDLCRIADVRANQLIGYGLIVGLDGTGDDDGTFFTSQSLINLFDETGVKVDKEKMKVKNVAAVMVTAELPPFAKLGDKIDVTVSALGNASDLRGGVLIQTPIRGADKVVYAVAQGQVAVGIAGKKRRGSGMVSTVCQIPKGAFIEKELTSILVENNTISLVLHEPDFTTASRLLTSINTKFGKDVAIAKDASMIIVKIPTEYKNNIVSFIAALEEISISPDMLAKVIINEQTGTVVMGGEIQISEVAVSCGNLNLIVRKPVLEGKKESVEVIKEQVILLPESITISEIVKALNSVGATPRDVITVLQTIKKAGALHAEIVFM